jgi:hypothetical protein
MSEMARALKAARAAKLEAQRKAEEEVKHRRPMLLRAPCSRWRQS